MTTISATYLIIFLPLISSLLCQLFSKKISSFLIALATCVAMLILIAKLFPEIFLSKELISDYELLPLSLALEFKIGVTSLLFLFVIIFLKLLILLYYHDDMKIYLDQKNSRIFYAVYLLHLFTIAGLLTSNNLLNLFLFLEIYAISFFAIFSISQDSLIAKLSFRYYCLNACASLMILFSFLMIYLNFGVLNLDLVQQNLQNPENSKFAFLLATILAVSFIIKFFPFWLYFENLKNSNLFVNFFAVDSIFIKANIGIFLLMKFAYLFFTNAIITFFLALAAMSIILYSLLSIMRTKHLKLIAIYSCLINFAFILICICLRDKSAMHIAFFYWLNFNSVGFFIFIFATFLKRKFNSSSLERSLSVPANLLLPLKFLLIFIAAFPFTFMFYGNWQLMSLSLTLDAKVTASMIFFTIIICNFVYYIFAFRLAKTLFSSSQAPLIEIARGKYWFYSLSFWSLLLMIYVLGFYGNFLHELSLHF